MSETGGVDTAIVVVEATVAATAIAETVAIAEGATEAAVTYATVAVVTCATVVGLIASVERETEGVSAEKAATVMATAEKVKMASAGQLTARRTGSAASQATLTPSRSEQAPSKAHRIGFSCYTRSHLYI